MAAFVATHSATGTTQAEESQWARGTNNRELDAIAPKKEIKPQKPITGEPSDEQERGEYLREITQPSYTDEPIEYEFENRLIPDKRRSSVTERVELSRQILSSVDSIENCFGTLGVGSEIEELKRRLASSYVLLNDSSDGAPFLAIVSEVEVVLAGIEIPSYRSVLPVLKNAFKLGFEQPKISDSDVLRIKTELRSLHHKSIPFFNVEDTFEEDEDNWDVQEETET